MKTVQIDRRSWHCRLAVFATSESAVEDKDFCAYVRAVLKGILLTLFLCAFAASVVYLFWSLVRDVFRFVSLWPTSRARTLMPPSQICLIFFGVVGLIFLCVAVLNLKDKRKAEARRRRNDPNYQEPPTPFLVEAYRALKEKVCFRLEIR